MPIQIAIGLFFGNAAALVVLAVTFKWDALAGFRRIVTDIFESIRPNGSDLFLIAVLAGWSEELFFRGTIQPLAGAWLTSLFFVVAHGGDRHRVVTVVL